MPWRVNLNVEVLRFFGAVEVTSKPSIATFRSVEDDGMTRRFDDDYCCSSFDVLGVEVENAQLRMFLD